MTDAEEDSGQTISRETRRKLSLVFRLAGVSWAGRLNDVEFLERVFDLDDLPSTDYRFSTARQDIEKHRILNDDWSESWVWSDDRFNLMRGPDETFLDFLSQTVSPDVRISSEEVEYLVGQLNELLRTEGWELVATARIAGRIGYSARRVNTGAVLVDTARGLAADLGEYVRRQITRMEESIDTDPDLAIGTAKEFLETISKTILRERSDAFDDRADDLPTLVRAVAKHLNLIPTELQGQAAIAQPVRIMLSNLMSVADRIAEIRNAAGTGHGKEAKFRGLEPRHARLAVHAAIALGVFLYETHCIDR